MAYRNRIEPDDVRALQKRFSRPPESIVPEISGNYDRFFPNLERDIIAAGTLKPKTKISAPAVQQPNGLSADTKLAIGAGAAAVGLGAAAMVAGHANSEKPSVVDRALERIGGIFDNVNNLEFKYIFPFSLGAGALAWLGKKTGWQAIDKASDIAQKPLSFLDTPLYKAGERMGVNTQIVNFVQPVADHGAGIFQRLSDITGLGAWRVKANTANAQKHFDKARIALAVENGAHVPTPLSELHHAVRSASTVEALAGDLVLAKAAEVQALIKGSHPTAAIPKGTKLPKNTSRLLGSIERVSEHHQAVQHWKSPAAVVKDMPKMLGEMPTRTAIVNGAWVGSAAVGGAFTLREFTHLIDALKDMDATITGKGRRSTLGILMGRVEKPVADLRTQILENIGVQGVMQTVALALALTNLLSRKGVGMKAFLAQAGLQSGAGMLMMLAPVEGVKMYKAFKSIQTHGGTLSLEQYAEFVDAISSDVRGRGGETRPFAYKVAEQLVAENASVDDILKEAANGRLLKRVQKIIADNETTKNVIPPVAAEDVPAVLHTQRVLHGGPKVELPKPERTVVGEHTHKVAQETSATPALGAGA